MKLELGQGVIDMDPVKEHKKFKPTHRAANLIREHGFKPSSRSRQPGRRGMGAVPSLGIIVFNLV